MEDQENEDGGDDEEAEDEDNEEHEDLMVKIQFLFELTDKGGDSLKVKAYQDTKEIFKEIDKIGGSILEDCKKFVEKYLKIASEYKQALGKIEFFKEKITNMELDIQKKKPSFRYY